MLAFGEEFQQDNEDGSEERAGTDADQRVKDHSKIVHLHEEQHGMVDQNERENVRDKCPKPLRTYAYLRALGPARLHLVMDQEWPQVGDQHRRRGVHTESIRKNIHHKAYCEGNEQRIHPVHVRGQQQDGRNVNEAERVVEQDDIPHEEDLQKQVKQDHQGILYRLA